MTTRLATLLIALSLAAPVSAQEHPFLKPDVAPRPAPVAKREIDPWLAAKIAGTIGVTLGSYADYQESQDAINERRAREGNGFIRSQNGYVNGKRKAALTASALAVSWWLYAKGHKRLAILADAALGLFYGGLAIRAHQIGR